MKAVTANRLNDGVVVYLDQDDQWVEQLADAHLMDDVAAGAALARAEERETEIVGPYLIEAEPGGRAVGQKYRRETIRAIGPTVRTDLHKPGVSHAPDPFGETV